eukprot:3629016-Alexandrium_andersonii.AAC.1
MGGACETPPSRASPASGGGGGGGGGGGAAPAAARLGANGTAPPALGGDRPRGAPMVRASVPPQLPAATAC